MWDHIRMLDISRPENNMFIIKMIGKIQILLLMVCVAGASYDEFLTCESLNAVKRSARVLEQIPCDMSKKPYCESMGSSYPRDAIWRFKEENRALMKRMVGDLDSREVYREMRSSSFGVMPINDHMFNGLLDQYNFRIGSGLARVTNAKEEKILHEDPPTERPTETTADIDYENVGKETVTVMTSTSKATTKITTSESFSTTTMAAPTTMQETIAPTMVTTEQPSTTMQTLADTTIQQDDTTIKEEANENLQIYKEEQAEEIAVLESRTESDYDDSPIPSSEYLMEEYEEYSDDKEGGYYADMLKDYTDNLLDSLKDLNPEQIEAVLPDAVKQVLTNNNDDYESIEEEKETLEEMTEEEEEELEIIEEVEEIPEIQYTGEAINACPVKVEVKAPYWANNTRNQVLALLNLYPFEQYIHMEECTYEFEEMLCRPGCRCEQQWRLHRLLAFDPNNECRGIFSDWFRFPSFCLCKCYNVPEQIIEGLRKPRVLDASQYKPKVKNTLKKSTKERAHGKAPKQSKSIPQKKKNEARNFAAHHQNGPTHDIPRHENHNGGQLEDQKLMNHRWTKDMKNPPIPAVFPYEGKMAYMAEISNRGGKGIKEGLDQYKETPEEKVLEELPSPLPLVNKMDENHQNNVINVAKPNVNKGNMYIKDTEKASKLNDDHFFYNQPIIEYKLSDGTTGTIPKTPRK